MLEPTDDLLVIVLFALASAVAPLDLQLEQAVAAIPTEGRTVDAFVPAGWKLSSSASGDLDMDGRPDAAAVLTLPGEAAGGNGTVELSADCLTAPVLVLVLQAQKNGTFRRAAVNSRLFPRNCEISVPSVEISKGVLAVNHNWRDGWAVDTTHRFRFGGAARLRLIGYDFEHYSRSSITSGSKTSENYLTGQRIESAKRDSSDYAVTRRASIPKRTTSFEAAALVENDDGDSFLPANPSE